MNDNKEPSKLCVLVPTTARKSLPRSDRNWNSRRHLTVTNARGRTPCKAQFEPGSYDLYEFNDWALRIMVSCGSCLRWYEREHTKLLQEGRIPHRHNWRIDDNE